MENLNLPEFKDKYDHYLSYTIGLEFETSMGYIPQDICLTKGLIPLRDGSISGVEYASVILDKDNWSSFLNENLPHFKKYTDVNKECSLHIHFGNYPNTPGFLLALNNMFVYLSNELRAFIPDYSFNTERYKNNRKSYCKVNPIFDDFKEMFRYYTGTPYLGSLTYPHPNDTEHRAKWNINTRYFAVNFINALCYTSPKTIEFRFLRPTFNYHKIRVWVFILNAIMKYCADNSTWCNTKVDYDMPLSAILRSVYPLSLVEYIEEGLRKLRIIKTLQENNGDWCGDKTYCDDLVFDE